MAGILAQGRPEDLQAGLPGVRYALSAPSLGAALAAARAVPGVQGAWIIGDEVRITAADPAPEAALSALGTLRRVPASLEDVFVAYSSTAFSGHQPSRQQGGAA